MTVKMNRNGKKQRAKKSVNEKSNSVKKSDTAASPESPIWQKGGKSGRGGGGFQSQPRSVGKRYWRS